MRSDYAKAWYADSGSPILAILARRTLQRVLSIARPIEGLWLEIGCGPGGALPTLLSQAKMVVGLDVEIDALLDAAASTRLMFGGSVVLKGSAYSLPFRDTTFDGVLALETFEHLVTKPALGEIVRVLKPGGRFVFSVPVEIGSSLVVRELARRMLRLFNPRFGPMGYSRRDFGEMVLGGDRKLHREKRIPSNTTHLFFSYRALLEDVSEVMQVDVVKRVPFDLSGPWVFSAVSVATKTAVQHDGEARAVTPTTE